MWNRKAVTALFAPIFKAAKDRYKSILNDLTIYTDGLRPDELSARIRLVKNITCFFENDLTK